MTTESFKMTTERAQAIKDYIGDDVTIIGCKDEEDYKIVEIKNFCTFYVLQIFHAGIQFGMRIIEKTTLI